MRPFSKFVLGLAAVCAAPLAWAHVRLVNSSNGNDLHWSSPSSISIVINSTGSEDITDGSHATALQNALYAWNTAIGSSARLVENTSVGQRARTDWESDDVHLLWFDESDSSDYFPSGSGIVALTPVWFSSNGTIVDADVLFNGSDFQFTTSQESGRFDVQDVATHELGHLLGLDHSGWAGATMYPYVDPSIILHRSLAQDDVCGARAMYPSTSFATIQGTIRREDDSTVAGAHVVARGSDGRPYAAALAGSSGVFVLRGLVTDTYTLYATPLDSPVSSGNLGGGHSVSSDFQSTVLTTVPVTTGGSAVVGNLVVGTDVVISLGRNSDDYPVRCKSGETRSVTLRGTGLNPGSTLAASDPSVTVTPLVWSTNQVSFQVAIPGGAPAGHVDLLATSQSGDRSILVAGLEITPADPVVASIVPTAGSSHGGTAVTIQGTGFQSGARVMIGTRIYADGAAGGCTVVDDATITLTTAASAMGDFDVVVMDRSGVEGRSVQAFEVGSAPSITSVFPAAGSAAGGTPIVVRGMDFQVGCSVTIDGIVQTEVTLVDETRITITTTPGIPGGPYVLEVLNPGGEMATSAFSYTSSADPLIAIITPTSGKTAGGDVVTIHGANFTSSHAVYFGADADTGLGGVLATSVTLIDAGTLEVVTPATSHGTASVVVADSSTGQAAVAPAAFTFEAPDDGGGGGGCALGLVAVPRSPFDGMSGMGAIAVVFLLLVFRARASRPRIAIG